MPSSLRPSDLSFVRSRARSFVLFVRSYFHIIVHSFVRSLTRSFVRSYVHIIVHSFARSFVRSYVHIIVHLFASSVSPLDAYDQSRLVR